MEFVRRNMLIIIVMAVGIVTLAVSWPLVAVSAFGELEDQMGQSAAQIATIRTLSQLDTATRTDTEQVQVFPNERTFSLWDTRRRQIEAQARAVTNNLQEINYPADLRVAPPQGTLPQTTQGGAYRPWYRNQLTAMLQTLNATRLPTEREQRAVAEQLAREKSVDPADILGTLDGPGGGPPPGGFDSRFGGGPPPGGFDPRFGGPPPGGPPPGFGPGDEELRGDSQVIIRGESDLAREAQERAFGQRALAGRIYAREINLTISELYSQTDLPNPVQLWYAHLGVWIQTDIIEAIRRLNAQVADDLPAGTPATVLNMPVKHLLGIVFSNYVLNARGQIGGAGAAEEDTGGGFDDVGGGGGRAQLPDPRNTGGSRSALVPQLLAVQMPGAEGERGGGGAFGGGGSEDDIFLRSSTVEGPAVHTGRVTTDTYGVVHVTFQVVIDSRFVQQLLDELSQVNLYTILDVRIDRLPPELESAGYVYGQAPVVLLTARAELVMFHQFYKQFMPPQIRAALKITDPNQSGDGQGEQQQGEQQ